MTETLVQKGHMDVCACILTKSKKHFLEGPPLLPSSLPSAMEFKTLGIFLCSKRKAISWDFDEAELKRKRGYSVPQYKPGLGDPPSQ